MTYYIGNRKSSGKNEKRSFGRATLLKKGIRRTENLKDKKDAHETVHKRATRKIIGIQSFFFCGPEVVKIFTTFSVLIEFHSIIEPSCWRN